MKNSEEKLKKPITPLWIISAFVALTETVVGVSAIQTTGGVQVAFTVFAIFFPILIFSLFILILWKKPYVLYSPIEFGQNTDVSTFVAAMKQKSSLDEKDLLSNTTDTADDSVYKFIINATGSIAPDENNATLLNSFENKLAHIVSQEELSSFGSDQFVIFQDEEEKFKGIMKLSDFLNRELSPYDRAITKNKFRLTERDAVTKSDTEVSILERMDAHNLDFLPVIDDKKKLIGLINRSKLSESLLLDLVKKIEKLKE